VDGRIYPLESARVQGRAEAGIAATTLIQRFSNPHDEPLEVVYTMPLPADGAVLGYTVRMGERVIRGEVQPRERAEKAYREALYQGRTAGLLEQDRSDTFQQRLGNLPPKTGVEIQIEVLHPLRFLGALDGRAPQWEYRFPTVVGIRYQGDPGRVPDAERLDVDRGAEGAIPTRVELDLAIADPTATDAGVSSPSHAIASASDAEVSRVRLAHGERLDRDIVLRWNAASPEVGVRLVEGGGLEGDDGRYALVTVVPPEAAAEAMNRDLTVLIDASGSMSCEPIELAKQVVAELIHSLEIGDRFELLVFSNLVTKLTRGLVYATPKAKQEAIEVLDRVQASGGTEMLQAVEHALHSLRDDTQRQIVLVTDGEIGFEAAVIGRIRRQDLNGVRVHAVGIGSAPNRTLLRGVAAAGRGAELFAGDSATAIEASRRLCAATVHPVLVDLRVSGDAVRASAPAAPRDVFAGQPALVTVELNPAGGTIEMRGRLAGTSEPWVWRTTVAPAGSEGRAVSPLPLGALHGRDAIADLELDRAADAQAFGIEERIEARGMRHRIVSSRTSLVAIAEQPSVDPKAPRRRERIAVETPYGVSAEGSGLLGGLTMGMFGVAEIFPARLEDRAIMPKLARTRSLSALGALRSSIGGPSAPAARMPVHGVVARVDGEIVVIELETPIDDFELPRGGVDVCFPDGSTTRARVVAAESSPMGPHAAGLSVKLALRFRRDRRWTAHGKVEVVWKKTFVLAANIKPTLEFAIEVTLPSERGTHEAT
jgi:Ca-activated chloride channel family protein